MSDDWQRYRRLSCRASETGIEVDVSRTGLDDPALAEIEGPMERAFDAMEALEAGGIANPDEGRMVGHYWLRAPERAPSAEIGDAIASTRDRVAAFAADVHAARIAAPDGRAFTDVLLIGIGGSALGPQLIDDALAGASARGGRMRLHFLDNTDPDGFDRVFRTIGSRLDRVLVVVVSKSGGTKETRNGMLVARRRLERAGAAFASHAVAVTGEGSELDTLAAEEGWLARFPMWDWVGGRTSVTSAVGLLPAALKGVDVDAFLAGARAMDEATRRRALRGNPAALLAAAWRRETGGRGEKAMVVLPYKDRLVLLSRYLQQLVMESLGKRYDRAGREVEQGITVYGNKGSTDQHAFVQQLRDGRNDFFVNFLVVERDTTRPGGDALAVEEGVTSGDYLQGFYLGTREALAEAGRSSLTIKLPRVDARRLGALIALYERAVGLYAELIDINAYHQPGVEAGKKAAGRVLELQLAAVDALRAAEEPMTVKALAERLEAADRTETLYHVLEHLAANGRGVTRGRGGYRATAREQGA